MQHNAAFHQGLHCLLRLNQTSGIEIHHNLENSTCDPLKYTMGSPILIVSYVWENPSEYKRLNRDGDCIDTSRTSLGLAPWQLCPYSASQSVASLMGAQWLGGRVLYSRLKACNFKPQQRHYFVSLSKTH